MAAGDLLKLWKLHLVDTAILEIRGRAAALDPGKAILGQIDLLNKELDSKGEQAKALSGELTDLELQQKNIAEKIQKIEKSLYGGKIVNPREVENFQKEIEVLRRQRSGLDERILELWDLVPPAKDLAAKIERAIAGKKAELAEFQKAVVAEKQKLEAEFKRQSALRPEVAKNVPPALLARYDSIRQKHGGVGMAQINRKNLSCGACGMFLPEKGVEAAKEDRMAMCEACHRILYYTEGLV